MTDRLVAYLLDDLSYDDRVEVEAHLLVDTAWREELERLRSCMAGCEGLCDCDEEAEAPPVVEPPCDLLKRTCTLVEESGDDLKPVTLVSARMSQVKTCPGRRSRFTLSDATVAAGVALILASLFTPTLLKSRTITRRDTCADNLRWLGDQFFEYQDHYNHRLSSVQPGQNAGLFSLDLVKRVGVKPEELAQRLICPDSPQAADGPKVQIVLIITRPQAWNGAPGDLRVQFARSMAGSYAYPLGYFDAQNSYHPPVFTAAPGVPMLADAPQVSPSGREITIVNHGGQGQNILDQSQAVKFCTKCSLAKNGDHIFLNAEGRHAAGCSPDDVVLGRSDFGPTGLIVSLQPVLDAPR